MIVPRDRRERRRLHLGGRAVLLAELSEGRGLERFALVSPATQRDPERRPERRLQAQQQDTSGRRGNEQPRGLAFDDPYAQSRIAGILCFGMPLLPGFQLTVAVEPRKDPPEQTESRRLAPAVRIAVARVSP